jgi:D-alanyl-lipoteichoic acid acyltransferase DltB (MBOAT superfamily)
MLNTMIVFIVSGLWHGAAYAFLIWGALHGAGMLIERIIYGDKLDKISNDFSFINIFRWLITFIFVNFAWILFRVNDMNDIESIFRKIFSEFGSLYIDINTLSMAAIALILVFIKDFADERDWKISLLNSKYCIVRYLTFVILVCYVLAFGVLNGGSFIYFQF